MSKDEHDDSAAPDEIPDRRASRVEWPLVKEPGAALESRTARHFSRPGDKGSRAFLELEERKSDFAP